jgi:hypothetical protein
VEFCGCCGREIACSISDYAAEWCFDCWPHIKRTHEFPHERTYFAQHNAPCPFQVEPEPDPDGGIHLAMAA